MDENRKGIGAGHIPFRQSKLTLALRDSFIESKEEGSKMIMIGCVSPGSSFSDYSLNTLWYASKLGGNKKYVASKYKNANFATSSPSLNTSQLVRARTGLNSSFDQNDKLSLQPIVGPSGEYGAKRPSIDADSVQESQPRQSKDAAIEKPASNRKAVKSQQQNTRLTGLKKTVSLKKDIIEAPRKGLSVQNVESIRKIEGDKLSRESRDNSPSKNDLLNVYLDTLKSESEIIRQESKVISNGDTNPANSITRNRKVMVEHIQAKISMLQKLQKLLAE